MVANDNHMSQKLEYATLPRDAPRPDEDRVIFIVNGSEHLSWSLHHGLSENFAQMVTWVTPHVHTDELDLDPCQSLFSYAAPQALTYLFGGANVEMGTKEAAAAVNKKRKVPWSTVYVLSAGNSDQKETQTQEEGIEYLFRDYPARLFKLRSVDFFTPEQGLNSTMPVDKVAALYGAWKDHGGPLLLLHAGHTIWYSAIGNNSNLLGGGISSGLGIRFQSLSDYCQDSFPLIESDEFVAAIKTATEQKKPLSMFGTDTRVAMIANITAELYGQLRNVIKQFEAKVLGANATNGGTIAVPEDVTVVITGRDMVTVKKMLRDGKNIVDVEDGVTPPKTNPDHYCLRKNLSFTGIQQLLLDKIGKEEPPNADDELRDAIFGLRVAKAELGPGRVVVAGDIVRGSVVRISRGKAVEEDLFSILFDDGDQKWVSIVDFYDALKLYSEVGEKADEEKQDWAKDKCKKAGKVQETLVEKSIKVKSREKELTKAVEKGETMLTVIGTPSNEEPPAKKQRKSTGKKTQAEREPNKFLNMRIAKYFEVAPTADSKNPAQDLYFGTIDYISHDDDGQVWWHVQYDDDDQEDFDYNQVREGIQVYAEKKDEDPQMKA